MCIATAKILDIPLVCSSHTHVDNYIPLYIRGFAVNLSLCVYRLVRREFLSMANANLTVSSDFMQMLECSGVKGKIHVWKTGVDSELFNPKYRSQKIRLEMFNGHYSPDKVLLVSIGRISPEKNFEFLLKILENCPETFLCIVGDGPYRKTIESSFPKHRTHFTGFLQGEKLASAYASADYFIYASVSETFGQVYLEAMSSGLPVVAAEGKQMKEFFVNVEHGNTWTPDCVDSAVKALRSTMNDHDRLARNCRATALKHSWDGSAEQIMQIYTNYIGHKQDKRPINMALRTIYYTIKYFILMLLVGLFMAPFVTRPTSLVNNQTKKSKKSNSNHQQDATTLVPMRTNNFLTILYDKFSSKLHEPNRVCAFLATLSALFLSLIVYLHHYLY
jgi:glycosyltransferase involved in cell wall biosynthesis